MDDVKTEGRGKNNGTRDEGRPLRSDDGRNNSDKQD
jgi:hypothetical protein